MTVIGSASIDIRANDRYFEPDVRRAVAKIKNVNIDLKVNADMSAANKKLRDLRYRMSQNEVNIKIRADDSRFETDVRVAVRKIKNVQIDLKADVDIAKASKKIRDLRHRITSKDAILKIDADLAKAEEKMRKFLEKFVETEVNIHAKAHTGAAHTALSDLQTRYGKNVSFTATADTKLARAALTAAARNRRVRLSPFIDATSMAAIKGAFNAITGTLPFDKIKNQIAGVMANFEGLVVKSALFTTAIFAASSAVLTLGANIFSIGGDITQVIGIAAMLPAAFIAMGTAIAANKMSWKGFGDAFDEDAKKAAKAMALLPPEAQAAAEGIKGVGREIQKATQTKFWEAMGTSLQDMVQSLLPQLKEGFEGIGASLGSFEGTAFQSIQDAFGDGVLLGILQNVAKMFDNMSEGLGGFIGAIATLGKVGATYLPQFGTYLADAGNRFGEFIRKADEAGKINDWIETAVRRFQELGSIVGSTTSIMSGLTEIARLSGAPGLTEMADGFRNIADVVNSEPFQSQLRTILEGARSGVEKLGEGLGTLTQMFWNSADSVGAFLDLGGEIAGLVFTNITELFNGTGLGTGLYSGLMGARDAVIILKDGFHDAGVAVGDLATIGGELLRAMAPGINMLMETIRNVIGGLKDGIIDALPIFNAFMQSVIALASGPLIAIANGAGAMLTAFSQLPGAIQTVIMSLGLLLLFKTKFTRFFGGIGDSLRKEDSTVGNFFRGIRDQATLTRTAVGTAAQGLGTSFRNVGTESARAAGIAAGKIQGAFSDSMRRAAQVTGTATGHIVTAFSKMAASASILGKDVGKAIMVDGDLARVRSKFQNLFTGIGVGAALNAAVMQDRFAEASRKMVNGTIDAYDKVRTTFGKIATAVTTPFASAANTASRHMANLKQSFSDTMATLPDRARVATDNVGAHFRRSAAFMSDQYNTAAAKARTSFNAVSLAAGINGVIARNHITTMARSIDDSLRNIPSRAATAFGGVAKSAAGAITTAMAPVTTTTQRAFRTMSDSATTHMGIVKTQVQGMATTASTRITGMATDAARQFGSIPDRARVAFNNVAVASAINANTVRGHFSDMARHASDRMANIGSYARSGFAPITTAATAMGTAVTKAFDNTRVLAGQVHTGLAPVRAAFTNLGTHITSVGTTALSSLGTNIMRAGSGLAAALGGGWGIAIMGAAIAVGAYAQSEAKAKARVEDLTRVIQEQGGVLGDVGAKHLTTNLMDGATTGWDDFYRTVFLQSKKVEEAFSDMGVSMSTVGKAMANNATRSNYAKSWDNVTKAIHAGNKPTEEMLKTIGLTEDQLASMDDQTLGHVNTEIQQLAVEAEKSEIRARQLAEAQGAAGVMGERLAANYETLGSATTSVSDKTSAFKDNLDILSRGSMTSLEASSRYEDSLRSTNTELETLWANNGKTLAGLTGTAGGFDVTTAAGNDLYKAMSSNKDTIIDMGIATMQSAITSGKSISVAKSEAVASMMASTGTLKQSLVNLGIDAETAQGLLDTLGLNEEKLTGALVMETDEANFKVAQAALAANAYASGNYAAALSAMPQEARDAILSVTDYAEAYKNGGWEAVITAIDATGDLPAEVISSILAQTDKELVAEITAKDLTADQFNEVVKAGDRLKLEEFNIDLTSENKTGSDFATVKGEINSWPDLKNVMLTAEDGTTVPLMEANDKLQQEWLNSPNGKVVLEAIDQSKEGVDPALVNVKSFADYEAFVELKARDESAGGVYSALDSVHYQYKLTPDEQLALETLNKTDAGLLAAMMQVEGEWVKAPPAIVDLITKNNAAQGITGAREGVINEWLNLPANKDLITKNAAGEGIAAGNALVGAEWAAQPAAKDLFLKDGIDPVLYAAKGRVFEQWLMDPSGKLELTTEDKAFPGVMSAKNSIETGLSGLGGMGGGGGLARGVMLPISVQDMAAEGTASAANTMTTGVTDQYRGIFASNNTAGTTGEAQATMETLYSVIRSLQAQNLTGAATAESQATMGTLQDVYADLVAENKTGGPLQASQATMNSLQNVMRDLQAKDATGGAKNGAQGTMNSLQNVMRDLNANNRVGGPVSAANISIGSVKGTDVDVIARDKGSDNAYRVRDAISSVVGKTVDVVTNFFRKDHNANGGVYDGGGSIVLANGGIIKGTKKVATQAFANGGFSGTNKSAVKAFAGGGIENHTAQIARGAWPVRVWAEPETGGEAYIPLSPNKRKRSLDILKIVMEEFGLSHLTKQFADGGIMGSTSYTKMNFQPASSGMSSSSTASPTPTATGSAQPIQFNVYPAEKADEEQIGIAAATQLYWQMTH